MPTQFGLPGSSVAIKVILVGADRKLQLSHSGLRALNVVSRQEGNSYRCE